MTPVTGTPVCTGAVHLGALSMAIERLEPEVGRLRSWAAVLADVLMAGGRLLAVGNGGSAAQAQHLTSELVGRYRDDRAPMSAIALHAETSALTAIANDYPPEELYTRQVRAHGRPGDVLVALSTSGRSPNILAAVTAGRDAGLTTLALTGRPHNPLFELVDDAVAVDTPYTATVQEVHQVVVHLLCASVDLAIGASVALKEVSNR